MDDQEKQRLLGILRATRSNLKAALKGVPKALLLWRPAPGKWSIQEIVCHMRDMEREAYLARFRRILAEENPTLPDVDGDVCALERGYREQKLSEVVREWSQLRGEVLKVLAGLGGDQWQRGGTHETAGPLTLEQFLRRLALGNDEAHLGQIEAIKQRWVVLQKLEAGPKGLAAAARGVPDQTARKRPADGKWSIVEHACHLRDVEQLFADRLTKTAFQERPAFWMMDNDRVAEARRYREANVASVVKEFARLRGENLTLLRALPAPAWSRAGVHPKRGDLSIAQMAGLLAAHDENHVGRIHALRS